MNQKTPPPAVAFMTGTILVALIACRWFITAADFPLSEVPYFLVLTLVGGLAHLYPIRSAQTNQATYVLANTFLFSAVILLSTGWLTLLTVGVWFPITIRRCLDRKPDWLLIPAANAAQSLLAAIAAHFVVSGWTHSWSPSLIDTVMLLVAIAGFVLFQTSWVAMVFHLARGTPVRSLDIWNRDALISDGVLLCLGAVLALLCRIYPALVVLVLAPVAFAYHLMRNVQLIRLGELDGKTGLYNARRLEDQFQRSLSTAKLLRHPLSIAFFDLDFLRNINNMHGHLAGDTVIMGIAQRIRDNLRSGDFAARFGGEEFVLLLPGTEIHEAHWLAERIRKTVAETPIEIGGGKQIFCSISGGVAAFPLHGLSVSQLTEAADAALYRAKGLGRNQICVADSLPKTESSEPERLEQHIQQPAAASDQTRPASPVLSQPAPPISQGTWALMPADFFSRSSPDSHSHLPASAVAKQA